MTIIVITIFGGGVEVKKNFGKTINIIFMYLLFAFIVQNLKKNPYSRLRAVIVRHFRTLHCVFGRKKKFFRKSINVIFIYLFPLFIVNFFKKIFRVNPELWQRVIFGGKWPNSPELDFFGKTLNIFLMYFFVSFTVQN